MTTKTSHSRANSVRSGTLAFVGIMVLAVIVFLLNFRLFFTSGPSMEPTYTEGTFLLASRLYSDPTPGDVVFLRHEDYYCMKRVAFVAGDDVSQAGHEGYWGSNIVPEGYVYVLGDNAAESFDSRDPAFGLIAISDIWGKPLAQRQKGTGN